MKRICFHKWSGWSKPFRFGYEDYQRKTCLKCGLERERNIGWTRST